jgi:CHAD domain-containing protein
MELDYVKLKEIKPALAGYVREAQALLKQAPVPEDKAVHDVRVLMKKSRAVMNLIANQTDKELFERDYSAFREIGRISRSWRESSVHRKTLKELKKVHPDIFTLLGANKTIEALMGRTDTESQPGPDLQNDLETIDELLNKAGFRIRFRNMNSFDPKILITELNNSYNVVIDKYLVCRNNPKPVNLHRFRKRAKDFLYQLYFFRTLNPSVVKGLEKKLDLMTQNLGKFNDLAQLIDVLEYKYTGSQGEPALDELIILVRDEQDRYLSKVWPTAYKVFCPGQKLVNLLGFRILMI